MNYRIVSSFSLLTRRTIYTFSKNPFDKFNRKKQTPQPPKNTQTDNQARAQKNRKPASRSEKINQQKLHAKKEAQNQKTSNSQQYKKANQSKEDKTEQNIDKQQNENIQKQQEKGSLFKLSDFFKTTQQAQRQKAQREGKLKQPKPASPAFKRFNKSPPKEKETFRNQPQNQQKAAKEVKQQKKEPPKEKQIPKITLQINNDDEDQTVILRKPKGQVRNRTSRQVNQPKTQKPQQKKQVQQEEEKKQAQMHLSEETKQFWQQFQKKIEEYKKQKIHTPRYIRMNLLNRKPDQKYLQQSNEKQQEQQPFKPTNFQNIFKSMILGGLFFYLWSDYFDIKRGKEVDPSYLKQALQQHRIDQTWINKNEIPKDSDEQIRGKHYHQYIYIRENNGDIYFCLSNQEFSNVWNESVLQYNLQTDLRTADYFRNRSSDMVSRAEQPPRKIVIGQTKIQKNSNAINDLRRILSFVLLYFFIKSLRQAGKGSKSKTGDLKDIFKNQKSHRVKDAINVTFKEVVGMQKAKEEIVQFIDFLKHPEKYNKLGARIPRGALLTGPPGTGKTMIAKACAGESKVPFFTISGSEFIEMYVGVGAQRVRDLFKQAKENAPSIIFIDEIDAVGKKRSGAGYGGGNDQRDTTLNQLLVQMDGFDTNTNVIVFAATNQKEVLDQALTRPGRFDRLIQIDLPDLQGRKQIFQVHLKPIMLQKNIDVKDYAKRLATLTPGFSGAQIKNVCNQAAIIAARGNKDYVSILDFELATQRIIGGVQKKSQLITEQTRRTVAYHECGHGVVSWFCKYANPLLKLTIIPRSKGALGFAQYLPSQNQIYTKAKLIDQICVILGGRISEQLFFGKISTGASDDLNKAYQIAKTIVTQYGFGDKLGWVQYDETEYAKEYSKDTQNKIDVQILQIMRVCTQRTRKIINERKDVLKNLAQQLLQRETIDQSIIAQVLGERPFPISKQHEDYIREKKRMKQEVKQSQAAVKPPSQQPSAKMKKMDYLV